MAVRAKSFRRPRGKKNVRKARVGRTMRKKTVARVARMEVLRMKETQDSNNNVYITPVGAIGGTRWATTGTGVILSVTPNSAGNNGIQITQGTGEGNRQGNTIRTVSARIRFTAVPSDYNATTNPTPKPFYLCWMVISAKRGAPFNQQTDVQAISADLYDNGSSAVAASRNTFDFMRPINNDKYTVHKAGRRKIFWDNYNGTGNETLNGGLGANNDFSAAAMVKLDLTKYCPKRIRYVDNATNPTSKPVWICFYTVWADGSAMDVAHEPCTLNILQDFRFKDM